ncbi:MAG: rhodanese-like domain-containing protein [Mailhella sp.]|nr:rhodanese-like domain-containing protein [Mailhella sp.]
MRRTMSRFLIALLVCFTLAVTATAGDFPASGKLNSTQGNALLERHAEGGLTILDVRTHGEYAAGHFPNALHIPLDELSGRVSEVPAGPVLIVCRSGRRAQNAYHTLVRSGRNAESLWFLSGFTDYSGAKPRFVN